VIRRRIETGRSTCILQDSTGYAPTGVFDATSLRAGSGGTDEVQTTTITGTPTGGTFTKTFRGYTTAPIAYNATADVVETALELLPSIGVGNVRVTGGPGPGTAYVTTFVNALGHANQPQMTASGTGLTGGTTPAVTVTTTTPGSATGYDPKILVGSFDKPGTIVIRTVVAGVGGDVVQEYTGTGSIYGIVDGIEEFISNVPEANRALPIYGKQAGLVVDARKIKNYATYKSAIDTWAAAAGVSVRHG